MATPSLVIFDLAGTTVKDNGEVASAFRQAFAAHCIELSDDQLRSVRGSSKRQVVEQLTASHQNSEQLAKKVYAVFKQQLETNYSRTLQPIDQAQEVFLWLRRNNIRVALNTGFDRDITRMLLACLGWTTHTVDAVVCGDEVESGRPAPDLIFAVMKTLGINDPHQVANVGDTEFDLLAGNRAGVGWNIGVLSGAHTRAQLELLPHTHLLSSIAELPALWNELPR